MCGRSGSAPPIGVSGAAASVLALAADPDEDEDESDRRRKVGRSGSLEGAGPLEADELVEEEDESVESVLPESRPLKCGRPLFASPTTWGMFRPCFGFARLGGA